jgi:hypothetical protein
VLALAKSVQSCQAGEERVCRNTKIFTQEKNKLVLSLKCYEYFRVSEGSWRKFNIWNSETGKKDTIK